jgi:asparagine synthase (glutamine-hydrolysing)
VPVGCYLSGGIDSAAVLGFAAEAGLQGLTSFTVAFEEPAYDESALAKETAATLGARIETVRVTAADLAANLAPAVWHAENLGYNLHGVARFMQSRAARDAGVKVVLSGDGGDEVFAGYAHCRRDVARLNGAGPESENGNGCRAAQRILGRTPTWLGQLERGRRPLRLVLADDFAEAFAGRDPFAAMLSSLDVARQVRGRSLVRQGLYLWDRSFLPNHLLLCDRVEMAHSIEVRPVFFDHKLLELTRGFPVSAFVRGSYEKWALREAMAGLVPDHVRLRPKHPFTAPHLARKTEGPLWELATDVLSPDAIRDVGFLSPKRVGELLGRLPTLPVEQRVALDQCLMLCLSAVLLNDSYSLTW